MMAIIPNEAIGFDSYNLTLSGDVAKCLQAERDDLEHIGGVLVPIRNMPIIPNDAVGVDLYNQSVTGDVSKTLNAISSDADHIPCVVEAFPMNPPEIEGGGSNGDGHFVVRLLDRSSEHAESTRFLRSDVRCDTYQEVIGSLCAEDRKGVQNQTIDQDKLIVMRIKNE